MPRRDHRDDSPKGRHHDGQHAESGQAHDGDDGAYREPHLRRAKATEVELPRHDDVGIVREPVDRLGLRLDEEDIAGTKPKVGQPFVGRFAPASNGQDRGAVQVLQPRRLNRFPDQVRARGNDDLNKRFVGAERLQVRLGRFVGDEVDPRHVEQGVQGVLRQPDREDIPAPDRHGEGRRPPIGPLPDDLRDVRLDVDVLERFFQGLSDERGIVGHDDLREKHVLLGRFPLAPRADVRRRQPEAQGEQVEGTRGEDEEPEVRELEHREGAAEKVSRDAARQEIRGGADEGEHPPGHRGVRERQQQLGRRGVVLVGEVAHHGQKNRDRRGVVDDPGEGPHETNRCAELLVDILAGVRRDGRLDALDGPGAAHALAQDHHREDGDGGPVGEARYALTRRDARPGPQNHERDHDPEGRDVDRHRLRDE